MGPEFSMRADTLEIYVRPWVCLRIPSGLLNAMLRTPVHRLIRLYHARISSGSVFLALTDHDEVKML